jgi:hypothetical protein
MATMDMDIWCPPGVFGGKLSFRIMSAVGRLCTFQENPNFWAPTPKVRPPDGILLHQNGFPKTVDCFFFFVSASIDVLYEHRYQSTR